MIARIGMPAKALQNLERLCRWHAAWQERCQALERLRVCISRKRISFRLFKQWYWESFDDDVQVPALTTTCIFAVPLINLSSVACCMVMQLWRASLHGGSSTTAGNGCSLYVLFMPYTLNLLLCCCYPCFNDMPQHNAPEIGLL